MSDRPLHPGERPPPARHHVARGTEFLYYPDATWQRLEGYENTTPGPRTPWEQAAMIEAAEKAKEAQGEAGTASPAPPPQNPPAEETAVHTRRYSRIPTPEFWTHWKPTYEWTFQKPTKAEQAWLNRIQANKERPEAGVHKEAPVWAKRRAELTSTLEYFESPKLMQGGSVHIDGGCARSIMLEGDAGEEYVFWGSGRTVGTIVVPLGSPRALKAGNTKEIKACLVAHRARVPIVVGVSQDYTGVKFRVPQPYIMLGMFWITDAWLEPVGSWNDAQPLDEKRKRLVRWRFRLDWCEQQEHPWWEAPVPDVVYQYGKRQKPTFETDAPWSIKDGGKFPSESVRVEPRLKDDPVWIKCEVCQAHSIEAYIGIAMCLNEHCDRFFRAPGETETTGFRSRRIVIRPIRHISRVLPSTLRIKVRPAPEEGKTDGKAPQHAAVNYWRGFCCDHCGRANERTTLAFWKCDPWNWNSNCPGRLEMAETAWSYKDLQPPMRIISTGPRVDEGTPQKFPKETIGVTDVWQDGLKVCKRVIPDQIEIHHALAHATLKTTVDADDLFRRLQSQYRMERVPQKPKVIATQDTLWPMYTLFLGEIGQDFEMVDGLPPGHSWDEGDPTQLEFIAMKDEISAMVNTLASRMIPGQLQFNKHAVAHSMPTVPINLSIEPDKSMSLFFLGCDCELVFYLPAVGTKNRSDMPALKAQHGDAFIVHTLRSPVRVSIKPLGLAFVIVSPHIETWYIGESYRPIVEQTPRKRTRTKEPREWRGQGPDPESAPPSPKKAVDIQHWKLGPTPILEKEPDADDATEPHSVAVV